MKNTKIEWCDHTVNLWIGCTKVHTGCDNCYAEKQSIRWGNNVWGNNVERKQVLSAFKTLDTLQKQAKSQNQFQSVFVQSLSDIFEKSMPVFSPRKEICEYENTGQIRNEFFTRINQGRYPNLIFLLLTKRPSNIGSFIPQNWLEIPPRNVWFGCSISDQKTAKDLIPKFSRFFSIPHFNIFLSIEPQVERVDLRESFSINFGETIFEQRLIDMVDWVICGGESGHHKRPFELAWAYDLKSQCERFGIPFFFKQIDKIKPIPEDIMIREFPINIPRYAS
jgi:protein gp37